MTALGRASSWMRRFRGATGGRSVAPASGVVDITDVIDAVLPVMLKSPGHEAVAAIADAVSIRHGALHAGDVVRLTCRGPIASAYDALFQSPIGRVVLEETARLTALLPTYDPSRLDAHNTAFSREFFRNYLRQSAIRVLNLIEQLQAGGLDAGTILEIGPLFGQFATTLKRLGYDVTVVDRYRSHNGAFDGYVRYFTELGIRVIEATRADEAALTASLGQFDAVISMAVIEHIPHTPREFLAMLASHVRTNGLLAVDTPNIARFWNRRRLGSGLSIHQDLAEQFACEIPYEGHHREYTAAEVAWMLEQVGCVDVRTKLFDYNLLEFPQLDGEHLEALLTMTVDPTYADLILAVGRVSHSG